MARTKKAEAQQAEIIKRQYQALELRKSGNSYRAIGEKLGVSHVQARDDIQSALNELAALNLDSADDLRQLELERIDRAITGIMHWIDAGSPAHVQALARLITERAKLLGLYAPEKREINVNVELVNKTVEALEAAGLDPKEVFEKMIQKAHERTQSSG